MEFGLFNYRSKFVAAKKSLLEEINSHHKTLNAYNELQTRHKAHLEKAIEQVQQHKTLAEEHLKLQDAHITLQKEHQEALLEYGGVLKEYMALLKQLPNKNLLNHTN